MPPKYVTRRPRDIHARGIDYVLGLAESSTFEWKRIGGKAITRILETVVAFANSEGGVIAIGVEDPDKAKGKQRLIGLQENLQNWDELRRTIKSRITENESLAVKFEEVACSLTDGSQGSIALLSVEKSCKVHFIVDDGTFIRLENPEAGRNVRRYTLANAEFQDEFFSNPGGKEDA